MKLGTFVRPYSMDPAELDKVFAPLKEMGFTQTQAIEYAKKNGISVEE